MRRARSSVGSLVGYGNPADRMPERRSREACCTACSRCPGNPGSQESRREKESTHPEIDDNLSIEEGARIAVVSKCKKGEFWDKVKEGMEVCCQRCE